MTGHAGAATGDMERHDVDEYGWTDTPPRGIIYRRSSNGGRVPSQGHIHLGDPRRSVEVGVAVALVVFGWVAARLPPPASCT